MVSRANAKDEWLEWTPVTNFAVHTDFINQVVLAKNPAHLRSSINNDLCYGLADLYSDHLPDDRRPTFFDESAPYDEARPTHNQWKDFPKFLKILPQGFRLFIDFMAWSKIELPLEGQEDNERDQRYGRSRWKSAYLKFQHLYPHSNILRIAYCLTDKLDQQFLSKWRPGDERELGYYIKMRALENNCASERGGSFDMKSYL